MSIRSSSRLLGALARCCAAFLLLLPLIWMIGAALRPPATGLPQRLALLPPAPTLANFARAWEAVPLARYGLNSLLVVLLAVPLTLLIASWAGFAMALLPRRSQQRLAMLSLAVLLIPSIALWSPRFLVYRFLGVLDTPLALIGPAFMGTSPLYVLLFYRAFHRIPAAIYDTARLDGAGVLRTWAAVALPMAGPTVVGVALLSATLYWGDLLSPLLYLRAERRFTLPVALQLLEQLGRADWPLLMAAAVIVTAAPVLLFITLQRLLIKRG